MNTDSSLYASANLGASASLTNQISRARVNQQSGSAQTATDPLSTARSAPSQSNQGQSPSSPARPQATNTAQDTRQTQDNRAQQSTVFTRQNTFQNNAQNLESTIYSQESLSRQGSQNASPLNTSLDGSTVSTISESEVIELRPLVISQPRDPATLAFEQVASSPDDFNIIDTYV